MGTLMLILCYPSPRGLRSLPATRCFCRSIQDLVPLEQAASPRPLRRHAVHSEDTQPCTRGHSMPAPPCCPPGHPGPQHHADCQPGRDGQLCPLLPSPVLGTASHCSSSPAPSVLEEEKEMPPALGRDISLAFCLAGKAAVLTNLASPRTHHLTWQQQPNQLPNPATNTGTSHQHRPQPVLRAGPGSPRLVRHNDAYLRPRQDQV